MAIPYIAQEENTMMKESREKRENGRKSPTRKKSPPPKAEVKIKFTFHSRPEKEVHAVRSNIWTRGAPTGRPTERSIPERVYTLLIASPSMILKEKATS